MLRCLQNDAGFSLVETPLVVLCVCLLCLILLQPVVTCYTRLCLGQVAGELARIVATDPAGADNDAQTRYKVWAADRLTGLPEGSAFRVAGSLQLQVQGDPGADTVKVTLSLRQKPLPLVGLFGGHASGDTVEVSASALSTGAQHAVEGSPATAPQTYGKD
ncbi:MAG: hypothetical protein LBS17_03280 [Actinomycetes bacterium]|jgi:hypothetical protein|nr:hypothetical protein [Actinomycetes bacterium]